MTALELARGLRYPCTLLLGFVAGLLYERRVQRLREQAFAVLSGNPLPEWEVEARKVEVDADKAAIHGYPASAAIAQRRADMIRNVGKARDKQYGRRP